MMKSISTGIENFKELLDNDYYYVDKTQIINDVLKEKVVLYTRPRRFGKTLNMSMLYYFFSNKEKDNAYLFNELKINSYPKALKHQNKYPVIFMSLKDMKALTFDNLLKTFSTFIYELIDKNKELLTSENLSDVDKDKLHKYYQGTDDLVELQNSLKFMSQCLEKHYHQKVIILIDEYDVPLQSAYLNNYYNEMTNFIGNVFSSALKTNDALQKGIMTGCLRIVKESIFTGLNNFTVRSIFDLKSANYFGFNQDEIDQLLDDYGLMSYQAKMKKWYDGYLFGKSEIYNPWSTLMYIDKILDGEDTPESFWANTSGNDIVKDYIVKSNNKLRDEFDILVCGGSLVKEIIPELTYREMDSIDNIYSFLLFTGYLKVVNKKMMNTYELMIPNHEIKMIYQETFQEWAKEVKINKSQKLIEALLDKDEDKANEILNYILLQAMSFYDSQESFYHGFMMGLMNENNLYSNLETGDGRSDIKYLPINKEKRGFILELKVVKDKDLYDTAVEGCHQIIEKRYLEGEKARGYQDVIGYGIAFDRKRCFIKMIKD